MKNKEIFLNCNYIPPEILFAAGFSPLRVWPEGIGDKGQDLLPYDYCPYSRAFLSEILSNNKSCVFANSCDAMRRVYDVVAGNFNDVKNKHYFLEIPRLSGERDVNYYRQQLERLLKKLEVNPRESKFKDNLRYSIIKYNQYRQFLKQLRFHYPFSFLIKEMKLYYSQQIEKMKQLIREKKVIKDTSKQEKPGVLISSSCLLTGDIIKLIEETGLRVLALDSCLGERSFNFEVELMGEDPLQSLARTYITKPPCPRTMEPARRRDEIKVLFKTRKADGLIYFIPKFCDQAAYDFKYLKEWVQNENIPMLQIEGEYQSDQSGRLKTRITAFKESLELMK